MWFEYTKIKDCVKTEFHTEALTLIHNITENRNRHASQW